MVHVEPKPWSRVLCLFCFQIGSFENSAKELVRIHNYIAQIETKTTACNESLARWTISALLSLQYRDGYMIAKLDDVKTSLFNGNITNSHLVQEKEIPEKANILLQPFIIKNVNKNNYIYLRPDEPLWSINMKRGIANHLNFDTATLFPDNFNETTSQTVQEQTLLGNCDVEYTAEPSYSSSDTYYYRVLNGSNCAQKPVFQMINTNRAPGINNAFDVIDFNSERVLQLDDENIIQKVWSGSQITYQAMPGAQYAQIVSQKQSVIFKTSEEIESTFDTTLYTDERNIFYEFPDEPTFGRREHQRLPDEPAEEFMKNYDIFAKSFFERPPENYNVSKVDPVEEMFLILMSANNEDLTNILNAMMENKTIDNTDMLYIYFSMLPYIGSNETVKYLNDYLINNITSGVDGAFLMKVFATIPRHIQNPSHETLLQMEPLLNWTNVERQSVRNSASLSFAAVVGQGCKRNMLSKKYSTRYVDLYHKQFLEGENYNDRATNLLGLINMAECLNEDLVNSITTNTSESSHIRALTITGLKNTLIYKSHKIYEIYWPIVQKHSEPFEVRVAALDLLLSAKLNEEEFNSILETYSKDLNEPEDRQLANYLLTTLHSIQNTTGYFDNLGGLASETLDNINISSYPKPWATGFYRLSYTDFGPNVGASFATRLITDPKTNIPNGVQITFNHFAMSYDFGTYNLHLKFDGVFDYFFTKRIIRELSDISSVPELLKLLKDNNFELKSQEKHVHIDIILFYNDVAVFVKHMDSIERSDIKRLGDESEEILTISKYISFPVMDYVQIPSELGTPITIGNYLQDITKHELEVENYNYRSSWRFQSWLEAYNPMIDSNIASYKYYVDEKKFHIKAQFIPNIPYLQWINENNTYVQFWDNMMGTAVEDEVTLKEYCQECEAYNELPLPTELYGTSKLRYEPLGFEVKVERSRHQERRFGDYYGFSDIIDNIFSSKVHQWNADALPIAAPVLIKAHESQLNLWLNSELSRGSYRSQPIRYVRKETETIQTLLTINVHEDYRNKTNYFDFNAEIKNRDIKNDILLNYANVSFTLLASTDGDNNIAVHQTCDIKFSSPHDLTSIRITGTRDVHLPGLRSDRLSLVPSEVGNGSFALITYYNVDDESNPRRGLICREVYTAPDISEIIEDINMAEDYEQCLSDSKNLKYTAPTSACKRISSRLTEYDDYEIYSTTVGYSQYNNITETKTPWLKFSRSNEDTLTISQLPYWGKYKNLTTYNPKESINPMKTFFINHFPVSGYGVIKSTCTVTPSSVEQFSGKYIPNRNKEWLAFAQCYYTSTTGLVGHTIDDNHVGFTLYSNGNTVSATVKDGHAQVSINGTIQNEYSDPSELFSVAPLDDNVIHIRDLNVDIYYNTEYISIQVDPMYENLLCGVCTHNN